MAIGGRAHAACCRDCENAAAVHETDERSRERAGAPAAVRVGHLLRRKELNAMDRPAIRVVQPEDHVALETFLASRLDTSMFLLGNLRSAGLIDHGQRYEGTYAAAFAGAAIVGVVAQY